MKTLKAPADCGSASVEGHTVEIVDGICEVDDAVASLLYSHGFTDVTPQDDPRPPADDKLPTGDEMAVASIRRMPRNELFALAKQNEVALTATMTTEAMREAMVDHFTRQREKYKQPEPKPEGDAKKAEGADGTEPKAAT